MSCMPSLWHACRASHGKSGDILMANDVRGALASPIKSHCDVSRYGPKLNPEKEKSYGLNQPGAPKPKLENEKPQGETVKYDDLLKAWKEGRVK